MSIARDSESPARLKMVFFGMPCVGSPPVLRALLAAGHEVGLVVVPERPTPLGSAPPTPQSWGETRWGRRPIASIPRPVIPLRAVMPEPTEDDLLELARAAGIPILGVGGLGDPGVTETIAAHEPDVIAVACFSRRLPRLLLRLPRFGCLNVHPSLLPRWRGPDPVAWTLRAGDAETGVTIHLMDEGFDTGPIVLQERIPMPSGVGRDELERELAERGGRLLVRAMAGLVAGELSPVAQDDRLATYAPWR